MDKEKKDLYVDEEILRKYGKSNEEIKQMAIQNGRDFARENYNNFQILGKFYLQNFILGIQLETEKIEQEEREKEEEKPKSL